MRNGEERKRQRGEDIATSLGQACCAVKTLLHIESTFEVESTQILRVEENRTLQSYVLDSQNPGTAYSVFHLISSPKTIVGEVRTSQLMVSCLHEKQFQINQEYL